jgi:oligopeptide transport system substrate-binding protein
MLPAALAAILTLAVACHGGSNRTTASSGQVLRVDWTEDPSPLEPAAAGFAATNVLENIMDPLVRLGPNFQAEPSLASSWDFSPDGKTLTFHPRHDGRWTNGDPVTAHDFVWSWLRALSPRLGNFYAYEFDGIVGARAYRQCDPDKRNCAALAKKVRIEAVDDYTLRLRLTAPQPWFPRLVSFSAFLALHRSTVEQYGTSWSDPDHIVTDGPFKLVRWVHDKELDLARWDGWRDAKNVKLTQVIGYMNGDGDKRLREYASGQIDATPGGYIPLIRGRPGFSLHPILDTELYVFNAKNVPDVNERRALALAIDRRPLARFPNVPAYGVPPMGMPGFDAINSPSPWLPASGDIAEAKEVLAKAVSPKTNLTLAYNKTCPDCKQATAMIARGWKELGVHTTIKALDWPAYLTALGPPVDQKIDIFRLGWFADYPDPYNFLQLVRCDSAANFGGYCNAGYDHLLKDALVTQDEGARESLYQRAEEMLLGPDGAVPLVPIYWERVPSLARPGVKGFTLTGFSEATYSDLSKVSIEAP